MRFVEAGYGVRAETPPNKWGSNHPMFGRGSDQLRMIASIQAAMWDLLIVTDAVDCAHDRSTLR